jgi:hypothetical protein
MTAILIIEAVAIALLAVLVVGLLRSHAEILKSLHDLGVREDSGASVRAPRIRPRPSHGMDSPADLAGQTPTGSTLHVGVTDTDVRTLLAFMSSGCSACVSLWEGMRSGDPTAQVPNTRLVVVTKGPEEESQSRIAELAPPGVTVIQTTEAWESYGVPVTPYFVLVDGPSGQIAGEGSASSWEQVSSLIMQAVGDRNAADSGSEMRADAELRRAGIGPGHSSLYPGAAPVDDRDDS